MKDPAEIYQFYQDNLKNSHKEGDLLKAACPFCEQENEAAADSLVVYLKKGFFLGYFRCLNRCVPGGYPLHFARLLQIPAESVPSFDPDQEPFVQKIALPKKSLRQELLKFTSLLGDKERKHFMEFGISTAVITESGIGSNGQYLVFPYYQSDGECYFYRCISFFNSQDTFWYGNDEFLAKQFKLFNLPEIERCAGGSIFICEGELNLLTIKELGIPGVALPDFSELETVPPELFTAVEHVFIVVENSPKSLVAAKNFAARLGFKARLIRLPATKERGYNLCRLFKDKGGKFRESFLELIKLSEPFSPLNSPARESLHFFKKLKEAQRQQQTGLGGFKTGFAKLDSALNGIRGINILGGQPKSGKSTLFIQLASEIAGQDVPVVYYDFENGRQKIYLRTLARLTRFSEKEIISGSASSLDSKRFSEGENRLNSLFNYLRVVNDRKLTPDIMRRQIEFIQHETQCNKALVVIDSLHKLPFKDLSERRTGIDSWLRQLESIRDEHNVAFLVISELSRSLEGSYDNAPDMGAFKGSGDIEYCADNAMVFIPEHGPLASVDMAERKCALWVVASRENKPGKVADYQLDYPFWGFKEI